MTISELNAEQMLKMCIGKRKYRTFKYAEDKAKYYTEKYGKPSYVYYCPLCGQYHLTTHKQ